MARPEARALLLTRSDIQALMTPGDYLAAVEAGFQAVAAGKAHSPPPLALEVEGGGFHAKAATIELDRPYAALKLNGNFPANPAAFGLPTIQGAILLCDGETGSVLAIMDSIEVTLRRTAAATALAAQHLARPCSSSVLVCGCGAQAAAQHEALQGVLHLDRGFCFDADPDKAKMFAREQSRRGFRMIASADLAEAARSVDLIVACTTATKPFLMPGMVRPGTFVAAVGADNPSKNEVAPALMAEAQVFADSTDQCVVMGDLHHAIAAGAMTREEVQGELADLVAGTTPGRAGHQEITVFDSTGTAIEDAASAAWIYERALAARVGTGVALAA